MYIENRELNPLPSGLGRSASAKCGTACRPTLGYNAGFESKTLGKKMWKDVVLAQLELLPLHVLERTQQSPYKTPTSSQKEGAMSNC
jgi:hypothetical protein